MDSDSDPDSIAKHTNTYTHTAEQESQSQTSRFRIPRPTRRSRSRSRITPTPMPTNENENENTPGDISEHDYLHHYASGAGDANPEDNEGEYEESEREKELKCCCGRPASTCAFLSRNHSVLKTVERDLDVAARLGQALLHRHESYMAEAESDRAAFTATIESLTREKSEIESANATMAHENRALVAQLEGVNAAAAESETRVQTLTMQLEEAESELRRLGVAAARVADLETQVAAMEADQERVMAGFVESEEEKRSAVQRWREAESTLRELHEQVDRIECEAREERERHEEVVARLERRRAVERELDGAAGRLKGAAAASELGRQTQAGGNVVSRFVRDILADNANLQVGIMELRDLLESSNQEVQSLRDQVLMHQPVQDRQLPTLSEELETKERGTHEYHIHHHYHTPAHSRGKGGSVGRRKKRRPQSGAVTPRSVSASQLPRHQHQSSTSSTSTILSQTSVSIPPSHRWSAQTTDVSIASSPQSAYHPSSIFDRPECDEPTSPNSTVFSSPLGVRRRKNSLDQFQSLGGLDEMNPDLETTQPDPEAPTEPDDVFLHHLRRSTSHDSLLSVAGMDVHTPSRSCAASRSGLPSQPIRIPRRIVSPSMTADSTAPLTGTTTVTATAAAGREMPKTGERSPRSSLLASVSGDAKPSEIPSTGEPAPSLTSSLGRRMGGWVKGKWGTAAVASAPEPDSVEVPVPEQDPPTDEPPPRNQSRKSTRNRDLIPIFRHTGVNQSGPVRGFGPPPRPSRGVRVDRLDEGLLRESLAE